MRIWGLSAVLSVALGLGFTAGIGAFSQKVHACEEHATTAPGVEAGYATCRERVSSGRYRSGIEEALCGQHFDMAPPYLVKCLRGVQMGFATEADKRACRFFCRSNANWGPWEDYEMPHELKPLLAQMRVLHNKGLCFED